jgi:hypothetical protein
MSDRPDTTDPADERSRAEHVIAAQLSRSWADRQESLRRAHSIVTALDGAGFTVAPKVAFPHKGMTPEQAAEWRKQWIAAVRASEAPGDAQSPTPDVGAAQGPSDGSAAESESRPMPDACDGGDQ